MQQETDAPHRPRGAIALGVALLVPTWVSAAAAGQLAGAASNEFLYNGPGMIVAVVACVLIAAGLFARAVWLIARPRPLRGHPLPLAATILAGLFGPVAAWSLYLLNCLLEC